MKKNRSIQLLLILSVFSFTFIAGCKKDGSKDSVTATWKFGDVYFDNEKWTECVVGNMPLVISVPHGGDANPSHIANRNCGGDIVTGNDKHTIEQAREIKKVLAADYNVHPYLVINHLRRIKIDQNREMEGSACGNKAMEAPWMQFHNYIDTALAEAVKQFGGALYIDLHGHGHEIKRLEIGYAISVNELNNVFFDRPNIGDYWRKSSLQNLKAIKDGSDFRKFILGEIAFGSMMEANGFRAVPSDVDPVPKSNEPYFNGGYNTRRYTSSAYPNVFGWQIESPYEGVRDPAGRPLFAKAFAKVIMEYLERTINYKP